MMLNFAACGALAYWGASKDYGWSVARAQSINTDLLQLVERLEQHHARTGQYPSRLTDLRVSVFNLPAPEIYDRGVGMLNQSKPYQYQLDPDGRHYLLFSVGLDGKPGTGDEMYPLVPDSLREDTGLRRP
jgi:hypothetical protein